MNFFSVNQHQTDTQQESASPTLPTRRPDISTPCVAMATHLQAISQLLQASLHPDTNKEGEFGRTRP